MGCLFQSIGIIIILVLMVPVMLLLSLFGRVRRATFMHKRHADDDSQVHKDETVADEEVVSDRINKPIDQSTVEYIDFEEVDDKK
ncbi:MAG: hypothetical protein IKY75_07205 [Bacteroidaceae bacterium]|nr:hypothetical protein [Bacteroidaceae bacterium]